MLCKYKNILGEPKKGLHSIRVFDIAIIDVLLTILGGYIINIFIPKSNYLTLIFIIILLFIIGIILHKIFCVRTTIDKFLFNR